MRVYDADYGDRGIILEIKSGVLDRPLKGLYHGEQPRPKFKVINLNNSRLST